MTFYSDRRELALNILGNACVKCGTSENLEVDHIKPLRGKRGKKHDILWNRSSYDFLQELKKCQLLCVNCHREKTKDDIGNEHGKGSQGRNKCKCEPCKKRKAAYWRDWYKKHGRRRYKTI